MKITIEPTENHLGSDIRHTVIITQPGDDQTIDDLVTLFRYAALALGYSEKGVNSLIDC